MTGPPTVDIHVDCRLTRTSCPLSPCLSALFQKISTSSDKHLRHGTAYAGSSAFWKAFKKPVATAGYKNKQSRKQTSVLSKGTLAAYVPLRLSVRSGSGSASLAPMRATGILEQIHYLTFNIQKQFFDYFGVNDAIMTYSIQIILKIKIFCIKIA